MTAKELQELIDAIRDKLTEEFQRGDDSVD